MKIDKLYTLSQFVDYITELKRMPSNNAIIDNRSRYWAIYRYNEFLKQPLTKEMFVNEIEPNVCDTGLSELEYLEEQERLNELFVEAEKKVIFKDVEIVNQGLISFYCVIKDDYQMLMNESRIALNKIFEDKAPIYLGDMQTLNDLAEKTNGELETKNIKI